MSELDAAWLRVSADILRLRIALLDEQSAAIDARIALLVTLLAGDNEQ